MALFGGRSNYVAWENSLTKRLTDRWQATITYTLGQMKDSKGAPHNWSVASGKLTREEIAFPLAPDVGVIGAPRDSRGRSPSLADDRRRRG